MSCPWKDTISHVVFFVLLLGLICPVLVGCFPLLFHGVACYFPGTRLTGCKEWSVYLRGGASTIDIPIWLPCQQFRGETSTRRLCT